MNEISKRELERMIDAYGLPAVVEALTKAIKEIEENADNVTASNGGNAEVSEVAESSAASKKSLEVNRARD